MQANSANELEGTQWRFQTLDGAALANKSGGITFSQGQIRASAGCNTMRGSWRVEDRRLVTGPLSQTEMYCAGAVWDQEKALSALLASAPMLTSDPQWTTITLTSQGHSARLVRKAANN